MAPFLACERQNRFMTFSFFSGIKEIYLEATYVLKPCFLHFTMWYRIYTYVYTSYKVGLYKVFEIKLIFICTHEINTIFVSRSYSYEQQVLNHKRFPYALIQHCCNNILLPSTLVDSFYNLLSLGLGLQLIQPNDTIRKQYILYTYFRWYST